MKFCSNDTAPVTKLPSRDVTLFMPNFFFSRTYEATEHYTKHYYGTSPHKFAGLVTIRLQMAKQATYRIYPAIRRGFCPSRMTSNN